LLDKSLPSSLNRRSGGRERDDNLRIVFARGGKQQNACARQFARVVFAALEQPFELAAFVGS
jgi:hypothetical protein